MGKFSCRLLLIATSFLLFFRVEAGDDTFLSANEVKLFIEGYAKYKKYDLNEYYGFMKNDELTKDLFNEKGELVGEIHTKNLREFNRKFDDIHKCKTIANKQINMPVKNPEIKGGGEGYEEGKGTIKMPIPFMIYRYGGKILTSLIWSVVNSYCGLEKVVMNDWYFFKYSMCLGYRLQSSSMASWGWIDMNFNFLDGITGFLIRYFIYSDRYSMVENIFDFFNVCIDIKVYNNLYFAINIVGIVRSIVLLLVDGKTKNEIEKK